MYAGSEFRKELVRTFGPAVILTAILAGALLAARESALIVINPDIHPRTKITAFGSNLEYGFKINTDRIDDLKDFVTQNRDSIADSIFFSVNR